MTTNNISESKTNSQHAAIFFGQMQPIDGDTSSLVYAKQKKGTNRRQLSFSISMRILPADARQKKHN
jgi:hypothetical protein